MSLDARIGEFVGGGQEEYYTREFRNIQGWKKGEGLSWNTAASLAGPLWAGWRRMWGLFWIFLVGELFALVQIARGLWADPGGEQRIRYQQLLANIAKRREQLEKMAAQGDEVGVQTSSQIIANLQQVADQLAQQLAQEGLTDVLIFGIVLLVAVKVIEGFYANPYYEKKYLHWRAAPHLNPSGTSWGSLAFAAALLTLIWPLTIFRFTVSDPDKVLGIPLTRFPLERELFSPLSEWLDQGFEWAAVHFGDFFGGVTVGITTLIKALEVILIETPWPVVMIILVVMAFRLVGTRTAIFTAASLAYLALMGLWEMSMITMALIGAATVLCLLIGIPLGVLFGQNKRAYGMAQPVLDFMQTMPAFVYLIPIIAFFGTGKTPGVLATIIFAMPPVVRLTALGIRSVPESTKEAAVAFGCTPWQLLRYVEFPLAMPSIMAGINQTIMMGLSMVVVASLIGAEGLGALILEALQYAAKGQGLLGGLAILLCAMVIDRMIQGGHKKQRSKVR